MNILITLNSEYADYAAVMLTSLITNNDANISVFCLYRNLDNSAKELLISTVVRKSGNSIEFIYMDDEKCKLFKNFPTTDALTVECYFVLMAHDFLPSSMERILYLDSDLLVDGDISELYNASFDEQYVVVAGQSHKEVNGNLYPLGARPKYGECFNSGVILFNLPKMRQDIAAKVYWDFAVKENYDFSLADQGILNLVFFDKAKYVDTMKYNFRMSIYRNYLEDGNTELKIKPLIIHFASHDFYHIGYATKPWLCTLSESEYNFLESVGKVKRYYGMDEWVRTNKNVHKKFWTYAHLAGLYEKIYKSMAKCKQNIIGGLLGKGDVNYLELYNKHNIRQEFFTHLTHGELSMVSKELHKYTYGELEQYIDTLAPETAKITLQNLHKCACRNISRKEKISVGFLVYSSAEWQCDRLYWLLEKDDRFNPTILICGYGHGTSETIKDTYLRTCQYFIESEKPYRIRYGGCLEEMYKDSAADFDVMVYITPFSNMYPDNLNFVNRKICQLGVHIPYGFYLEEKKIPYYNLSFYEMPLFKMGWRYFAESKIQQEEAAKEQRLKGYNIITSGLTKIDDLLVPSDCKTKHEWKTNEKTVLKIIWAPHFNMQDGMNGTFHENYKWFYSYAEKHEEIAWILRPHPRMGIGTIVKGVFPNLDGYRQYLMSWRNLPNAVVVDGGGYYDIFRSSDCMILDSLSFLAEYQYTGKPLLRLLPEKGRFMNDTGEQLNSVVYRARGNDFESIKDFIQRIAAGQDNMKSVREDFFCRNLDYKKINKCLASEKVFHVFSENL